METNMNASFDDRQLLEAYVASVLPYDPSGLPTQLDSTMLADELAREISSTQGVEQLRRLAIAATYYDVRTVTENFKAILAVDPPLDIARRAIAAEALLNLGDADERTTAIKAIPSILAELDVAYELPLASRLRQALGPGDAPDGFGKWANQRIDVLTQERAKAIAKNDDALAEDLEIQIEKASAALAIENEEIAHNDSVRHQLAKLDANEAAVPILISAYVDLEEVASDSLRFWSACEILRRWRMDEAVAQFAINALRSINEQIDAAPAEDDEEEEERALVRASVIRGVQFFGGEISADERKLLSELQGLGPEAGGLALRRRHPPCGYRVR